MTQSLRGMPAAPGVALGPAWRYVLSSGGESRLTLDEAATLAASELDALAERLRAADRPDEADILSTQALMIADPALLDVARDLIAAGGTPAAAIVSAGESAAATLDALDDELLAARAADVRDVAQRLARVVTGQAAPRLERRSIVVAADLPPSVTAELQPELLAGIALEAGSRTAHAAILARALGVPAVVGVAGLLDALAAADAQCIAIDGESGEVLLAPDESAMRQLEERATLARDRIAREADLAGRPLTTRDGERLMLGANIGRPQEAAAALAAGAEGIGLFRTEFMFMGRDAAPDEATQAAAYAAVLEAFGERPVVIRLIDLGGDKDLPYLALAPQPNPFLGVRGLRLAERDPELILTQLRAILAAGEQTGHQPWIMAPMIADLADVYRLHEFVALAAFGRPATHLPKVGVMIEVPSAVTLADRIAAEVAFMSIGTNDLTQYLLAADRTNPALAARQDPLHPAVLRSIHAVIEAGHAAAIPVAVCGEMAGDPAGALALLGLGIDELSMDPSAFGAVKRAVAGVTRAQAAEAVRAAMQADRVEDSRAALDALR